MNNIKTTIDINNNENNNEVRFIIFITNNIIYNYSY